MLGDRMITSWLLLTKLTSTTLHIEMRCNFHSNKPPSNLPPVDEKARKVGLATMIFQIRLNQFMPGFRKILLFQLVIWHSTSIQNLIREELKNLSGLKSSRLIVRPQYEAQIWCRHHLYFQFLT